MRNLPEALGPPAFLFIIWNFPVLERDASYGGSWRRFCFISGKRRVLGRFIWLFG